MAVSNFIFNNAKAMFNTGGASGLCYWSSTTASYYGTLVRGSYAPSESHVYASAFSGSEVSTAAFTAGYNGSVRISFTNRVLRVNNVSNQAEFAADTLTWSALASDTGAMFMVIQQAGSDGTSPLVAVNGSGFPISFNGTNFVISFGSAGIFDFVSA